MYKKDYHCNKCGKDFDVRMVENVIKNIMPKCPHCNSKEVNIKYKGVKKVAKNKEK